MSGVYEIANDQGQITIRLDSKAVDHDALTRFLDFLELESLRKRSTLTEEQAAELAEDIDRVVWEQIKHKYTE